MAFVISSLMPFPNILWWRKALQAQTIVWDMQEHFEKMTYHNRYHIASANGLLKMSIPIKGGREHKTAMAKTEIANHQQWQHQQWRTIITAYNNAPYFYFYQPSLEKLFTNNFTHLAAFNLASIHWLKQQLNVSFQERNTQQYQKNYPDALHDLRHFQPSTLNPPCPPLAPQYHQVFEDRNGFIPNLSLLDLLFAEGPYIGSFIKQ